MTALHALDGDRGIKVCDDPTHLCSGALVIADGPLAGQDVRDEGDEYQPRPAVGFPYGPVWLHGVKVPEATA